ncbi:MAG: 23S rRNA (adenine(2503)-C(2))-methyltransferase RlmN [Nitrospirae bacterium]|nr:23S rRNA (adenine(2503)-C(2))-methyltransferase RlmN [Nitrospirota bacterium]
MKINLKQLQEKEMHAFIERLGQSPFRARQVINWIYKKSAASFDEMTDLPVTLREELKKTAYISNVNLLKKQVSKDGTQKFLFELEDGKTIESVLIPDKNRHTLCISSQVGCAMECKFCMTGRLGLKRNLMAYEMVDQVIAVSRIIAGGTLKTTRITNIVFMGMGEPLNNFDEVIDALRRLTGIMDFSGQKITISTAGIVPKISALAQKGPGVNLAVSLNASTDEIRSKIMPVNKRYPIKELITACKRFPLAPRKRITFEYVLLKGINDSKEDAVRLIKLLRGIKSKVNLIPYNSAPSIMPLQDKKPVEGQVLFFQKILTDAGITAIIRKSKGQDILAACGQLQGSNI